MMKPQNTHEAFPLAWAWILVPFGMVFSIGTYTLLHTVLAVTRSEPLAHLLKNYGFSILTYAAGSALACWILWRLLRKRGLGLSDLKFPGVVSRKALLFVLVASILAPVVYALVDATGIPMFWQEKDSNPMSRSQSSISTLLMTVWELA